MQITRKSPISGKYNTKEIEINDVQYDNWMSGQLIQDAMPHLSADDREFIKSGITPEEWEQIFGQIN
jgi:hypothetical protein